MWGYIKQEARESRLLQLSEYTPSFCSWAGKYVGQDLLSILVSGSSLARAAANIVVTRIHRRTKRNKARQKLDLQTKSKISKSHTETENFNSTQLERHPTGHVPHDKHSATSPTDFQSLVKEMPLIRPLDDFSESNDKCQEQELDSIISDDIVIALCYSTEVKVYKSGKAKLLCSRIPLGF